MSGSVSRTYDDDRRLASSSVNDAQTVTYSYDDDGLLTGAGALTLTPDPDNGLLQGTSMTNAGTDRVSTSHSYNGFGEQDGQTASYGSRQLFNETVTDRDALGRIEEKTETTSQGTHTYRYSYESGTGFLDTIRKDGVPVADYAYDANGNRQSKTANGSTLAGSYDSQDRLLSYGANAYRYTEAGDLESRDDGTHVTTYAYDEFGALEHVTLEAETQAPTQLDYVNDGLGRRIAKKRGGNVEQGFLYGAEAQGPAAELNTQGNVLSRFVYATRSNVPDYIIRNGATYRVVTDYLGSPRVIVDAATGQVAQEMDYDEFGVVVRDTNPGFQPFGFAGGLYDRDTNLVRFGARDYDAQSGRWTSKDPIRFASGDTNLYGYVIADPINFVDPSGLVSVEELGTRYVGFVDGATFGGTSAIRDIFGWNGGLDKCSLDYRLPRTIGTLTTVVAAGAVTAAGAASAAANPGVQMTAAATVAATKSRITHEAQRIGSKYSNAEGWGRNREGGLGHSQ